MLLLEPIIIKEINLNAIKSEWLTSSKNFPDFLSEISYESKKINEQYIQVFSNDFQKLIKSFPRMPFRRRVWNKKMIRLVKDLLHNETIIGLHNSVDPQTIDAFMEELKEFLRHVRSFSPELTFYDIGQAILNYIVFIMFKEILQVKSEFDIAGFGYSMLYPFTDNYIDSQSASEQEKKEYNQIIRDKIEGKVVRPKSEHQFKTCELLQYIESKYPRETDSTIYRLLLMMLEAQELSLRQDNKHLLLTYEDRLNISLYKGGISVLVDRYIASDKLAEEDIIFYLGMGFFLQLADDLQDIREDSISGHQTIFTSNLNCAKEELLVNKLLNFIHQISEQYHAKNEPFKDYIIYCCYQLIFSSVIGSKEFFSEEYLKQIERYLPVTYPFLEKMQSNQFENKDIKIQSKYLNILDELLTI
jgi:hypothetical protein